MKVSTQGLGGGRTRARTWDPMIKSYQFDGVIHLEKDEGHPGVEIDLD
jgi:hypothetical protein